MQQFLVAFILTAGLVGWTSSSSFDFKEFYEGLEQAQRSTFDPRGGAFAACYEPQIVVPATCDLSDPAVIVAHLSVRRCLAGRTELLSPQYLLQCMPHADCAKFYPLQIF